MRTPKPISFFNADFSIFRKFDSLNDAARHFKTRASSIKSALDGKGKFYLDTYYVFSEADVKKNKHTKFFTKIVRNRIMLVQEKNILKRLPTAMEKTRIKVIGFSFIKAEFKVYDSQLQAAHELNTHRGVVSGSASEPFCRTAKGFYFLEYSEANLARVEELIKTAKKLQKLFPETDLKRLCAFYMAQ